MKKSEPKPVIVKPMWAVFAPDGHMQVRSIAETKKLSKKIVSLREYDSVKERFVTWDDYKAAGFTIHKVTVTITIN